MEARQVIAHAAGIAGCALIAYGMRGVMSFGCTDTAASCTADVGGTLLFLIGGIVVTVFSILAGAVLLFPLLFLSIGVGAVVAGLQQGELFPIIFGVVFAAMATIPFIVMTKLRSFMGGGGPVRGGGLALSGLSSRKGVNDLLENGIPAVATILSIHETGTWIDEDPQVTMRARLEPVDGNPYEAEKSLVMSLVNPIRLGARIPALIYPENHAMFGLIVDITDPSKVPPRLRTLVDELSALEVLTELADESSGR